MNISRSKTFWHIIILIIAFVAGNSAILYALNTSDGVEWVAEQLVRSNKHYQPEQLDTNIEPQ